MVPVSRGQASAFARIERLLWAIAASAALVLQPTAVLAAHSSTSYHGADYTPLSYWDSDFNHIPDDPHPFAATGAYWNTDKRARMSEAASEWRNQSVLDPTTTTGPAHNLVYLDGRVASCDGWSTWPAGYLARTCQTEYYVAGPGFNRITDADIFFNTVDAGHPIWDFTNTYDSAPVAGQKNWKGVMTHELGHGARLQDTDPGYPLGDPGMNDCRWGFTDQHTMCASITTYVISWRVRTIEGDDIRSADRLY